MWKVVLLFVLLISGCTGVREEGSYACKTDADCVKKGGSCTVECLHRDEEPRESEVVCKFRPWFKREKCTCINGTCTKISCEEMDLDYKTCDS